MRKRTPTDLTAFQCVRRARVGGSQLTKVFTIFGVINDIFSQVAGVRQFARSHAFRNRNDDLSNVVLNAVIHIKARLIGQEGINFTFRNIDLFIHFTLTQTLRDDLVADFFSKLREVHAV